MAGGLTATRKTVLSLTACLLLPVAGARGQDVPQIWWGAWDYLVENICVNAADHPLPGLSPLDVPAACPRQRKLRTGERLPYHKRDWPGIGDGAHLDGYQQSDSVPVQSRYGPAVVQTYDFGDDPRSFGQFDTGDGGQVAFFTADTAAFGITEDGGAGLQFFIGPGCQPVDSWVIVDSSFATQPAGEMLARITLRVSPCPVRLGYAFTRWHVQPVTFRTRVRGKLGQATLQTLVSDHFGGRDVASADHLERMYFTHALGYTRWERWQHLAVHDRAADRAMGAAIAATQRCAAGLGPPTPEGWIMVDCREWTQMAPPADPAGDKPDFWIAQLRANPSTAAIFPQ